MPQWAWAQPSNSSNPQVLCFGAEEPYCVDCPAASPNGTPGSTYAWSVISGPFAGSITVNPAFPSQNHILIDWATSPADNYVLQVIETNAQGCAGDPMLLNIQITPEVTPTFAAIGPLCQNSTAPALPGTSTNGITGSWSPAIISTSAVGTTTYTFTPNDPAQCAIPTTLDITITQEVTPTFAAIGPLCQNSAAPALPGTSSNGITGSWSPSAITTTAAGTFTFTFTPNDPSQCAIPTTLDVTITPEVTPTFAAIGPLCQNSTAPSLLGTSTNGITGSWSPSTITTTAAGTFTFTFTPNNPAQCAIPTTLDVTITPEVTPTFAAIGPLCQNSTAPALPGTSTNGITGSWSPSTITTTAAGTFTFTFTPNNPAQCAIPTTLDVTITPEVTPTFAAIGPLCQNSTAPALPGTSTNGITGSWSPTTINTSAVGTTTYTFTPNNPAQCAIPTTLDITITQEVTPTFAAIGPLCQNSTAPALPGTSTNGITGSWSPTTINTSAIGTTTYTFTPNDPAQCAIPTSLDVTINALPEVTVNSETICFGADAIITATPTVPGTYDYAWTVPAGASDPGNVASFTATVAGNYTVTISTTGTPPCSSLPASGTLTVNPEITTTGISHN